MRTPRRSSSSSHSARTTNRRTSRNCALVEKTLADKKINLTPNPVGRIGLDPSKSVGTAFELEGYPTLVILDGKGTVQSVHVGLDSEAAQPLSKTLAKEIDALLEGKSLGQAPTNTRRTSRKNPPDPSRNRKRRWCFGKYRQLSDLKKGRENKSRPLFLAAELLDITNGDQAGAPSSSLKWGSPRTPIRFVAEDRCQGQGGHRGMRS